MTDGQHHEDVESQRNQLRERHGLPDPTWSIPPVEGTMLRLASVEEMLARPHGSNGNGRASSASPRGQAGTGSGPSEATDED